MSLLPLFNDELPTKWLRPISWTVSPALRRVATRPLRPASSQVCLSLFVDFRDRGGIRSCRIVASGWIPSGKPTCCELMNIHLFEWEMTNLRPPYTTIFTKSRTEFSCRWNSWVATRGHCTWDAMVNSFKMLQVTGIWTKDWTVYYGPVTITISGPKRARNVWTVWTHLQLFFGNLRLAKVAQNLGKTGKIFASHTSHTGPHGSFLRWTSLFLKEYWNESLFPF